MIVRNTGKRVAWLFAGGLLFFWSAGAGALEAKQEHPQQPPCCFTHTDYTGACVVQPGEGETCASILEYLNTPETVGKTYCGSTRIRGGWSQVTCEQPDGRERE